MPRKKLGMGNEAEKRTWPLSRHGFSDTKDESCEQCHFSQVPSRLLK